MLNPRGTPAATAMSAVRAADMAEAVLKMSVADRNKGLGADLGVKMAAVATKAMKPRIAIQPGIPHLVSRNCSESDMMPPCVTRRATPNNHSVESSLPCILSWKRPSEQ